MKQQFNIPRIAEGLTTYAIERQNGFERHQPAGAPPWAEQRRSWTDAVLQGMARLDDSAPDPSLMERFDRELEEARRRYFIIPATLATQRDTIHALGQFVNALDAAGGDRRRQVQAVQKLMEDMACHPHWGGANNGLGQARENAERTLQRMTARMPIRFTRVLLGGERGPCESDFVSGAVTDAGAVRATALYERLLRQFPEITEWPSICTVYVGRGLDSALGTVDASSFDIAVIRGAGDRFLDLPEIRFVGGRELNIPAGEMTQGLQMNPTM
nr:hypothetical protein [uncultured Oscillibacter sp.]